MPFEKTLSQFVVFPPRKLWNFVLFAFRNFYADSKIYRIYHKRHSVGDRRPIWFKFWDFWINRKTCITMLIVQSVFKGVSSPINQFYCVSVWNAKSPWRLFALTLSMKIFNYFFNHMRKSLTKAIRVCDECAELYIDLNKHCRAAKVRGQFCSISRILGLFLNITYRQLR